VRRRGSLRWSTQPYSSKPTCNRKDEEEYIGYSITRRRGGTQWSTQHTPPLLLVMETVAYSLPSIIYRRARSRARTESQGGEE
jgi:hypothetical protein